MNVIIVSNTFIIWSIVDCRISLCPGRSVSTVILTGEDWITAIPDPIEFNFVLLMLLFIFYLSKLAAVKGPDYRYADSLLLHLSFSFSSTESRYIYFSWAILWRSSKVNPICFWNSGFLIGCALWRRLLYWMCFFNFSCMYIL